MRELWLSTCRTLSGKLDADAWLTIIESLHSHPPRAYHNLVHVRQCLDMLAAHREAAQQPELIELAIWFHDCVYVPGKADNEVRSAAVGVEAARALGLDANAAQTVARMIMATKHIASPADADEALLMDIDMSVLAWPAEAYATYASQIRQEFAFVSDSDFAAGRAKFLAGLLSRDRIFYSAQLSGLFERPARDNIAAEISRLGSGN